MKSRIILCVKTAWLTTVLALLLMGTSLCQFSDTTCGDASGTMLIFMLILSFPTGVFFAIGSTLFLRTVSFAFPSDLTLWLIMAVGGFLQWFIVTPRLFAKHEITILNLNQNDSPLETINLRLKDPPLETPGAKPAVVARPKRIKPISAFDNRGRSPLERVIARVS
jgi:hypothetical protein